MSEEVYYKFNWESDNGSFDDGGKYYSQRTGFFFVSSTHPVFEYAKKCKRFLDKCTSEGLLIGESMYSDYSVLKAAKSILDNRMLLTNDEYEICRKIMGQAYLISGSVDSGGPRVQKNVDANLLCSIIKESFDEMSNEYDEVIKEMKKNRLALLKSRSDC